MKRIFLSLVYEQMIHRVATISQAFAFLVRLTSTHYTLKIFIERKLAAHSACGKDVV